MKWPRTATGIGWFTPRRPDEFREDLRRARGVIEDASGTRLRGYRARASRSPPQSLWALDVLAEEGYDYDASIFPIRHDRYGLPTAPRHIFRVQCGARDLVEAPGSTVRIAGVKMPMAGGGYFRILPYAWTRWGIDRLNRVERQPAVFYLHPWEIDPHQPRLAADALGRFRHYRNLINRGTAAASARGIPLRAARRRPPRAAAGGRAGARPRGGRLMGSLALAPPAVTTSLDAAAWDRFVEEHPEASGYHLSAWRSIFEDVFGHRTLNLSAVRDDRVVGILPLVEFRSRLFGRFAVSLPFVNQGGVVAEDDEAARTLVSRAVDEARSRGLGHIELRHEQRRFPDLADKQHKVSMRLRLPDTSEALWNQLDRKVRNQIRKAEKSGLVASSGGAELVDAFYAVFTENMRDLGTPVYPRGFFASVMQRFPGRTRIHVVRLGGEVVASSLTFAWRDSVEVPWASSLRKHRDKSPNNLLYWAMLQQAIAIGGASSTSAARRRTRGPTPSSRSGAHSPDRCTGSTGWLLEPCPIRARQTRSSRWLLPYGAACPCG